MKSLQVLIVDDHALIRETLGMLLSIEPDIEVVGQATRGEEACRLAQELKPDVVIMDVSMPGIGGTGATKRLLENCPDTKILALSAYEEEVYVRQLLAAGAAGYVLKRTAADEIVRAIRVIMQGGLYLDPSVAGKIAYLSKKRLAGEKDSDVLSDREREVLRFTARGYTHKEIASLLGVSVKTIETYKSKLAQKLDLHSRAEIVRYALAQGWLDQESMRN